MDFRFVNRSGYELNLTDNPYCHLIDIDGQTSVATDISSVVVGKVDGDTVNNIRTQPRPLILTLRIKNDVEESKREILNVVKLKQKASIIWTQNAKSVKIEGIVEAVDMPRWNSAVAMQITLHCEKSFWEDIDAITKSVNEAIGLHYFTDNPNDMLYFPVDGIPFGEYDFSRTRKINNDGDVDVGMRIEILAYDTVTNPIIYNHNGEFLGVGYGTGSKKVVMQTGDLIIINTTRGQKSITKNGQSLFGYIKPQSTWIQLEAGMNTLSINSDDESIENMTFSLSYKRKYI